MRKSVHNKYPAPFVIDAVRFFALVTSKILWRIKYHDQENIPQDRPGGLLIVANHQTYFDPFWICAPIRRKFSFMAWNKAFDWFLIGHIIKYLGAFPVDTARGVTKSALRKSLNSLNEGATLTMFPEGAREFADGRMLRFKTGALRIAMEAGVPVLPVTVSGGNRVWAQGMKFPHFRKVEIFYHPLFEVQKPPQDTDLHEHLERLTAQIIEIIGSKLKTSES